MHSQVHHAGCITLAAAGVALSPPGLAAEQSSQSMAFYALGVALDGAVTVGDTTADIDLSTSEVLDHLEFAAMGSYRYQTEPWSLQVDVIYASLTGEKDGAQGGARAKVDLDQAMIEINGGYRVHENIELIAGARYWEYETDIGLFTTGAATQRAAGDKSWLDPLIGARLTIPIGSNWEFVARGDIGGFGVGSDFAWHATALFNWRVSEHFGVLFGYRIFDVDFEGGSGRRAHRHRSAAERTRRGSSFRFLTPQQEGVAPITELIRVRRDRNRSQHGTAR